MNKRDISIIDKIIIHCADSKISSRFDVNDCRDWHIKGNGWSDIGYHYYIELDGSLHLGRPIHYVGSHCKGENTNSIGICLEGGKNADGSNWTMCMPKQKETLKELLKVLGVTFQGSTVHGHYEFSSKTCPNFKIKDLGFW